MMMMITGKVVNFRLNCGAGFFRGKPSIVIDRGHMLAVAAKYRCMNASREPPLFIIYERRRRAALSLAPITRFHVGPCNRCLLCLKVCSQHRNCAKESVTLRSLYALVSHLCPTGLPEVAMPYSDMWQDCQITLQHTRPCYAKSDPTWKRPPGRPRTKWTDQLHHNDNNVPTATLWRQATGRGQSRATLRSEPTMR